MPLSFNGKTFKHLVNISTHNYPQLGVSQSNIRIGSSGRHLPRYVSASDQSGCKNTNFGSRSSLGRRKLNRFIKSVFFQSAPLSGSLTTEPAEIYFTQLVGSISDDAQSSNIGAVPEVENPDRDIPSSPPTIQN